MIFGGSISYFCADWVAAYMLLALAWIFAPVYHRCQLTTIPELLEKRFNKQCRSVTQINSIQLSG